MKTTSILAVAAAFCFAILSIGCGGAANTAANTGTTTNKTNTAVVTNTTNTSTTNTAANTTVSKTEGDSVGVPECDEYIKKYEACLTSIAAKAPQAAPALKTAFEAQRNGFKTAASTPQGKATLASTCKQAIETAKASTSAYACQW